MLSSFAGVLDACCVAVLEGELVGTLTGSTCFCAGAAGALEIFAVAGAGIREGAVFEHAAAKTRKIVTKAADKVRITSPLAVSATSCVPAR